MTDSFSYMLPGHGASEFERTAFRHEQESARTRTMIPVKVVKVWKKDGTTEKTQGAVEETGFVDVLPLVSQMDGRGQKTDHVTIFRIPYTRAHGGDAAIIVDPVKGDIGYIKAADRDISSFKANAAQDMKPVLPGSQRRHDLADSIYVGGILNDTPKRYVTFGPGGTVTVADAKGSKVMLDGKGNVEVIPGGGIVFLGGTGSDGSYDFVSTVSGPSVNVKAKIG